MQTRQDRSIPSESTELTFEEIRALAITAMSGEGAAKEEAQERLWKIAIEKYKNRPGFFTPYKSGQDLAGTVAGPVTIPLTLGIVAGVIAIGAAVAAAVSAVSLLFATGAGVIGIFNKDAAKTAKGAAVVGGIAALATIGCAIAAAALVLIAAIATPLAVASIFTRGGATVVSAVSDCFADCFPSSSQPEERSNLVPH
ncbi:MULTISPECIES: hypothetical protein [Legionella]|uniref:Uncharacterized protein n=1 Tax=Legionella maceachernii TaxID=466 RepID=A0A0W0VXN9_9GAMM|nr:hypothetical protein [Legionella maceachernii]KTD24470.1 hypothetical protein Lmac_2557 [Legionella maceachernii]SJZ59797.1 hypothetical protein SAMN02745128_00539 [Legionella maceachernii]SUP00799.1 Uncharacterised protein [Legionella maceachernii]